MPGLRNETERLEEHLLGLPLVEQSVGENVAVMPAVKPAPAVRAVKVTLLVWPVGQPFWPVADITAEPASPLVVVTRVVLAEVVTYGGGVMFSKLAACAVSGTGVTVPLPTVMQVPPATLVPPQPVWNPRGILGATLT